MTWSASHTSSRSREPVTVRMGGEGRIEANDAAPRSIGEPRRYRGGAARPGRSPRRLPPYGSRRRACTPRTGPVRGLTADAPRGLVDGSSRLRPISSLIKKESPARIDSEEAAIGRPTQTAPPGRGLGQPQRPTGLRQRAPAARRLARRPRARRRGPRGVRCRTARRRACFLERLDGGRRGVVPREAQRPADPGRREDRPGAGRLPADRRRSGAPAGAAVRGLGSLRPCLRHLPPGRGGAGAASSPRRSPSNAAVSMRWSPDCSSWPGCGAAPSQARADVLGFQPGVSLAARSPAYHRRPTCQGHARRRDGGS